MNSCLGIEGLGSSSICIHPSIIGSLGTSLCQVIVGRPFLTTSGGMSIGYYVGGRPLNLVHLPCIFFFLFGLSFYLDRPFWPCVCFFFCVIVRDHPKLESRFEERVWAAVEYVSTINNFDDIVDPRTLARHFLGPEPSYYILNAIHHEERSESFWRKLIAYISSSFLLFLSFSFFF